jgi:hypothetical protein
LRQLQDDASFQLIPLDPTPSVLQHGVRVSVLVAFLQLPARAQEKEHPMKYAASAGAGSSSPAK